MSRLLVVRHGECVANTEGVVAGGGGDSPLTERGRNIDAILAAKKLAGYQVDQIISSPMSRAYETAQIIRDQNFPGIDISIDERFTERDVGSAAGIPLEEYFRLEAAPEPIPGAELAETMFERVKQGLAGIGTSENTTLLVTHNGTARMIACILEGLPAEDFANIAGLRNGEVRVIEL